MSERKRCCCNCGNDIRTKDEKGNIECYCAIDGHRIGYVECFEHWCRRWKRDRKWDEERNTNAEPTGEVDFDYSAED